MSPTDEQLAKQLPTVKGFKSFYRLRWRFQYADGKPDVYGQWNGTAIAAWSVDKTNLLYALIEGEKFGHWTQKVLVRVPGQIFATAKWVAGTSVLMGGGDVKSTPAEIVGLTLQTNDEAITAFIDGSVSRRALSAADRKFKLREHTTEV